MAKALSVVTIRSSRPMPILVCRKCLKRFDGGRKLRRDLKTELKRRSTAGAVKRPRLVQTDCFGICPKRAVVLTNGSMLAQGEYLLMADSSSVTDAAGLLMPTTANAPGEGETKADHCTVS
jgi:hypothetical protein